MQLFYSKSTDYNVAATALCQHEVVKLFTDRPPANSRDMPTPVLGDVGGFFPLIPLLTCDFGFFFDTLGNHWGHAEILLL